MGLRLLPLQLVFVILCPSPAASAPNVQHQLLITTPPKPEVTGCGMPNILKRQESCEFGDCGGTCLSQGAFCCGPAGSLVTSPYWVCDNGACITSVRGTNGVVDCYDPDNPSATTQSCIDNVPTTTCQPTDRCYTCNTFQPFCRWETYIADGSPTLSWFSCVETKLPDATFLAATITNNLPSPSSSTSASGTTISTSTTSPVPSDDGNNDSVLSTGAIIGIAVGGGVSLIGVVLLIYFCCIKKRKDTSPHPQELGGNPTAQPMSQNPTELDSQQYARSELNSTTAYSPHSQAAVPFTTPDGYERNYYKADQWRRGVELAPEELQSQQADYFAHDRQELHGEYPERQPYWVHADEQARIDPNMRS